MGLRTLQQFRDALTTALARDLSTTQLDGWIHGSMYEFGYALKFHALEATGQFSTESGKYVYDPNDDFRVMHEVGMQIVSPSDCIGRLIPETRVSWRLHRDTDPTASFECPPQYYHVFGNQIFVRPAPGSGYVVEYDYWKKIPIMSDPSSVSVFSADWDDIILVGALYRGFRDFGEFDRYKNVRNDFLGLIRSRVAEEDLEEFPEGGIGVEQSPYDVVIR
jgi:hypothetical protein